MGSQSLINLSSPFEAKASSLPSDERASDLPGSEHSRFSCKLPVAVSQSLMAPSKELEARSLPLDEKTSEVTEAKCPSSVSITAFQSLSIFGCLCSQLGICSLNLFLMILVSGAKTIAEEYNCSGAVLSISRFLRRKRLASCKKSPSTESTLDLIKLANVKDVVGTALPEEYSLRL